jgi:type IX secretion system PorP/SprF family membrane protein
MKRMWQIKFQILISMLHKRAPDAQSIKSSMHWMIKFVFVNALLTFACFQALGQKNFLLSMPESNRYALNPAYAGLESSLDITAWGREQWSGIPGRPSTQSLVAHMPIYALNGGGGMRIINDRLGPLQYLKFELGYDYVKASERMIWSLGVTAGINQISYDGEKLRTNDGLYTGGLINHNDPNLPNGSLVGIIPNMSIGAYLVTDAFEGGISLQDIHLGGAKLSQDGTNFDWSPRITSNLFFEYGIDYNDKWYFDPIIFIKYDFKDLQALLKFNAMYDDVIRMGIGVRGYSGNSLESLVISAGYQVDSHFSVHYAYDIGLGGLATDAAGSHEIILRYNLNKAVGKGRIPKVIGNPRYL